MNPPTKKAEHLQRRWRFVALLFAVAPFALIILWECGHYARFGHFFPYGYHADLVLERRDLGVPEIITLHCLRVTNYTFHALAFEAIQTPTWGITDGAILYHDRVEKWNKETRSWSKLHDSTEADNPPLNEPNTIIQVLPGRSIQPMCVGVGALGGVEKGDTVRLVALTAYVERKAVPGQNAFYSPPIVIRELYTGPNYRIGSVGGWPPLSSGVAHPFAGLWQRAAGLRRFTLSREGPL